MSGPGPDLETGRGSQRSADHHRHRERAAPRRSRRLLGVLVVLAVLGGGAAVTAPLLDDAARGVAERRVADQLATETGATGGVQVDIGGRWFVPQLLRGSYPRVGVVARDVPTGAGVELASIDADLRGVSAPLREVLDGGAVRVARSQVRAELTYRELNAFLADRDDPLEVSPEADEGLLHVTGSTRVLGVGVALSGEVALEVASTDDGGVLKAVPQTLDTGNGLLDGLSRSVLRGLRDQLAFTVPLDALPLEQRLVDVEVAPTGVVVLTEGSSIVVGS